mmetsp:Transcript_12530/g.27074  ORF Transcript_12530/g.27074 Transcript_12530/m.27074 type:complete len:435 (-) Transcript_12530:2520-3824(-)
MNEKSGTPAGGISNMSAFGVGGNGFSAASATNNQAQTLPSSSIAPPTSNNVGGTTAEDMAELSRLLIVYDNDLGQVQAHLTRESERIQREELQLLASSSFPNNIKVPPLEPMGDSSILSVLGDTSTHHSASNTPAPTATSLSDNCSIGSVLSPPSSVTPSVSQSYSGHNNGPPRTMASGGASAFGSAPSGNEVAAEMDACLTGGDGFGTTFRCLTTPSASTSTLQQRSPRIRKAPQPEILGGLSLLAKAGSARFDARVPPLLGACGQFDRFPGASTGDKTPDAEKLSPIHIALQSSATDEVVKLLALQHPATLIIGDNANRVPLSIAIRRGSPSSILNILLSSNPQAASIPDARNNYPLHHACARRLGCDRIELPLLRRLSEAYPDAVHKRNFDGKTPLDLAQSGGLFDDDAIDYLHELAYKDDEVIEAPDSYV